MALDVLERTQIENLIDHLQEIYPQDLNESMLKQLKQSILENDLEVSSITREITDLFKGDKEKLEAFLYKYQIAVKDLERSTAKVEEEVKQSLDMQEITDFVRDGRTYIKITYGDGHIQIIENRRMKDTKQIFEDVQKLKAINNIDGRQNAEEAFKELLKDYVEVPLFNTTLEDQTNLKVEDQAKLKFVEMNFPKNRILASPTENIFIVKGDPDLTVEVIEKDGHYEAHQLEEVGYASNKEEDSVNAKEEVPSVLEEKMIEDSTLGYSLDELEQITVGMTEEEIVQYLKIHGKNQQQIMVILLELEERKSKKQVEQDQVLEKPRQMVLKNGNDKRIAAFIDGLMFAFIIGMCSGTLFCVMLHFILNYL